MDLLDIPKKEHIYSKVDLRNIYYLVHITKDNVSQKATYWFVIGWFDIQRAQKSEV